ASPRQSPARGPCWGSRCMRQSTTPEPDKSHGRLRTPCWFVKSPVRESIRAHTDFGLLSRTFLSRSRIFYRDLGVTQAIEIADFAGSRSRVLDTRSFNHENSAAKAGPATDLYPS